MTATVPTNPARTGKPLKDFLVIDFSQFLSCSLATLRFADLGARVIKIERPGSGDIGRSLYLSAGGVHGENTLFHAINRNKESYAANLKDKEDLEKLRKLISHADVMVQNFRPGVMDRLGLGYDHAAKINPKLVYGAITGYGNADAWRDRPGQDLLAQARSGIMWLSGNKDDPPTPMALSIADMLAGHNLCEGILACLVRRSRTGLGGLVETSLLESLLDLQFEVLTTYLNDGRQPPQRSAFRNANAYLGAPYGVYDTADGHLALAMNSLPTLGRLLGLTELTEFTDPGDAFGKRDEIKRLIAGCLRGHTTEYWLNILNPADIWCADVLDWPKLLGSEAIRQLQMIQKLVGRDGLELLTTRSPISVDTNLLTNSRLAPQVGEHTAAIQREFGL